MARAGVDEHVAHQVDVDRVRRKAAELVEAVGELLHARILSRLAASRRSGPDGRRVGRRRGATRWILPPRITNVVRAVRPVPVPQEPRPGPLREPEDAPS